MKKILLLLFIALSIKTNAQNETITNKSITEMIEIGFSDDIIIAKIKEGKGDFNTNIEALKDLKDKGVSDAIIVAIMGEKTKTESRKADIAGIFIDKNGELIKILPTVFSGTKTSTLAAAFTYGIADATIKSTLNGATSRNVIQNSKPEFLFYFTQKGDNNFATGATNWWFNSATSPNEFALVKLAVKKNKRELQTGKANVYAGSSMGVSEEQSIKFVITQIDEYSFRVNPESPLEPGEYCFFYQGVIPQGGFTNQSVFDFSIPKEYGIVPKYEMHAWVWISRNGKPYYYEVKDIKIEPDGVYYLGVTSGGKVLKHSETECFPSKKELLNSTMSKTN